MKQKQKQTEKTHWEQAFECDKYKPFDSFASVWRHRIKIIFWKHTSSIFSILADFLYYIKIYVRFWFNTNTDESRDDDFVFRSVQLLFLSNIKINTHRNLIACFHTLSWDALIFVSHFYTRTDHRFLKTTLLYVESIYMCISIFPSSWC